MEQEGLLSSIRLLVAMNRVCDAEIRIARDLGSHRHHREEFWKAASALGGSDAFPPGQGFESVQASHRAFADRGVHVAEAAKWVRNTKCSKGKFASIPKGKWC